MAKKWILGQKTAFSARNSAFFYATPMKPPIFRVVRTRLNGIITSPYLEVTLDTFGFRVGAHSAVRQAVVWPQLPKITIFGPKTHIIPLHRMASLVGRPTQLIYSVVGLVCPRGEEQISEPIAV